MSKAKKQDRFDRMAMRIMRPEKNQGEAMSEPVKMSHESWTILWDHQTPEQRRTIQAKADWEHVSLMGVFRDWPTLFTIPKGWMPR